MLLKAVDIHIVIADALHLCESHSSPTSLFCDVPYYIGFFPVRKGIQGKKPEKAQWSIIAQRIQWAFCQKNAVFFSFPY